MANVRLDPEWEVLPPEEQDKRSQIDPLFRWIAVIMDDLLRVPGTRFRIGLDPIIGLLPGLGDTGSALVSAFALIAAARRGVPRILLARMALNILVNELVGLIPGIGDAFSFWFKSNRRNYDLLQKYAAVPGRSRKGDWLFVSVILFLLLAILVTGFVVSLVLLRELFELMSSFM